MCRPMHSTQRKLNTKENSDEYTGSDDGNSEIQEGESQQEIGKGDEGSESKKDGEGTQGQGHQLRKQDRESPGIDEAQGRRNSRRDREGDRLAESQHPRIRQRARYQEAGTEGRIDEERSGGADLPDCGLRDQRPTRQQGRLRKGRLLSFSRLSAHVALSRELPRGWLEG